MIPLVAEDYLLEWVSNVFTNACAEKSWKLWMDLIKLIQTTESGQTADECDMNDGDDDDLDENADDNIDIFDANNINLFGETVYITYKCYEYLKQCIDDSSAGNYDKEIVALKERLHIELPFLSSFCE